MSNSAQRESGGGTAIGPIVWPAPEKLAERAAEVFGGKGEERERREEVREKERRIRRYKEPKRDREKRRRESV